MSHRDVEIMVLTAHEFEREAREARLSPEDTGFKMSKLVVGHKYIEEDKEIETTISLPIIILKKDLPNNLTQIKISDHVLINLRSIEDGRLYTKVYREFHEKIQALTLPFRDIPFTTDSKQKILFPYTRKCAAGIILAFFNGNHDPYDRITGISNSLESHPQLVLVTYYLSCISYILQVDLKKILTKEDGFSPLLDDTTLVKIDKRNEYESLLAVRDIPVVDICFHALYGAYTFCRAVATKQDFNNWVTKRYNALRASMHQSAIMNPNLKLQNGGTEVNAVSSSRVDLKRVVLSIIRKDDLKDPRAMNVKSHIKLLTQLSEMTTFSLINRVIAAGGPILALAPLVKQLSRFSKEKALVEERLIQHGAQAQEIYYLTLVMPNEQHFIANDYADMIVAAQALEKVKDPRSKTIDQYKAKTENASLDPKTATIFYQKQRSSDHYLAEPNEEDLKLVKDLGIDITPLVAEARKILEIIRRQDDL